MKRISIIIPTCNRPDLLKDSIERLASAGLTSEESEIIVVDDNSEPELRERNRGICIRTDKDIKFLTSEKKGPAAARNRGIRESEANIILFTGDDIMMSEETLKEHLRFHENEYPGEECVMAGAVEWDKNVSGSRLHEFLDNVEFQFRKAESAGSCVETDFHFFYSSNLSLKKSFLTNNGIFFDEKFPAAAWEDIEFGYRLSKAGMKIFFNKKAIGLHKHKQETGALIKRMETSGKSLRIFLEKWPELAETYGYRFKDESFSLRKKIFKKILRNRILASTTENMLLRGNLSPQRSSLSSFMVRNMLLYYLHKGFKSGF